MIDRLVYHAEVIALKGTATGSRNATSAASPQPLAATTKPATSQPMRLSFNRRQEVKIRTSLTRPLVERYSNERPAFSPELA
jgi:hypothetical protein